MKRLIFIFIIISLKAWSQDTIRFRNGDVKAVKINEVGVNEIKYKSFNNPDGPAYITSKSEIKQIKYQNGNTDNFIDGNFKSGESAAPNTNNVSQNRLSLHYPKTFLLNGILIHNNEMEQVLKAHPNAEIKNKLLLMYTQSLKENSVSYLSSSLGYGVGFGIVVATSPLVTGLHDEILIPTDAVMQVALFGIVAGAVIRITGSILHKVYKNKAAHLREQMVDLYNNGLK